MQHKVYQARVPFFFFKKKNYTVFELGKLKYHLHSTRVYQARVPLKKKKNLHSTRVYLYVYFLIIPKQEKKKKNYTVLEFTKLEYYVNFFFF